MYAGNGHFIIGRRRQDGSSAAGAVAAPGDTGAGAADGERRRTGTGDGPEPGAPGHDGGSAAAEVRAAPADALRRRGGGPAAGGGPAVPHRPGACPADGPGAPLAGAGGGEPSMGIPAAGGPVPHPARGVPGDRHHRRCTGPAMHPPAGAGAVQLHPSLRRAVSGGGAGPSVDGGGLHPHGAGGGAGAVRPAGRYSGRLLPRRRGPGAMRIF